MTQAISGNTYPVRQQLAAMGGRWDAARKAWMIPDERAAEARKLVSGAPAPTPRRGGAYDPQRFNGYGRARGGYVKACISGGNCSSIGSGRSCGGHDCDGY